MKALDLFILLISLFAGLFFLKIGLSQKAGSEVEIEVSGEVFRYPLSVGTNMTFNGKMSEISVVISNDSVWVSESGCPAQICVRQGAISSVGSSIICVPNEFSVRISGSEVESIDALTE